MMTGTLNVEEISEYVHHHSNTSTIRTAFAFITVGASIKLALWPLHTWLPNAYTYAPSVVSAFLSATATKVSFYVLIRAMFTIFGAALATHNTIGICYDSFGLDGHIFWVMGCHWPD